MCTVDWPAWSSGGLSLKQNNDKETNLTSRKSMHSMKNNEN